MKKLIFTILSLFILSIGAFAQAQKLNVPLSKPDAPFVLKAGLIKGSIIVSVHSGKDIIIDVEQKQTEFYKDSKEKGGMTRIGGNGGLELEVEEKDNVVDIHAPGWSKALTLNIKVPSNSARIELSTVNNGDISVKDLKGEIELKNVNGEIVFSNISGSIIANTVNGDIKGTIVKLKAEAPLAFSTLNGNVDITFPASFKADVKLKSDRGDIYTDFDISASTQDINKSTSTEGRQVIKLESWVRGKINGGGPEVLMKNMNGNIYLRKAK